jgi:hypothetical protein
MRFLIWLRVVDSHDGRLSLSAVVLLLTTVLLGVVKSAVMLGAFSAAVALYAHRRTLIHRGQVRADYTAQMIDGLKDLEARLRKAEVRLSIEVNRPR